MSSILGVKPPAGYQWLIDRRIVGFAPFTQLQPWFFVQQEECFWATDKWQGVTEKRLLVFARRQDCDDLACLIVNADGLVSGVALIQGWTDVGFDLVQEYPDFWAWLKNVVQDIEEWVSLEESE